mgnify:CR=1 FL=1
MNVREFLDCVIVYVDVCVYECERVSRSGALCM